MLALDVVYQIIRNEVPIALSNYAWQKAILHGFFRSDASGLGLTYADRNEQVNEPRYIDEAGYDCGVRIPSSYLISDLLSRYFHECQESDNPWNEVTFIMDRESNIEHSFVMNYQRVFQQKITSINTAASGLAERVYEHLSGVLPDNTVWEAGSATLNVREGKVSASYRISIGGVPQTQPLKLDGWERKMWLEYYNWIDSGELKGHFPAWNTIKIQLPFEESDFNLERDVMYLVK
ncbi:hypothetical protein [uncultured Fibrella sp.]|uniref:hypothetical protein n=1 Tax=uncultured Fibrella sp. TaxID=1284596 RepID=UPI0035C97ED0